MLGERIKSVVMGIVLLLCLEVIAVFLVFSGPVGAHESPPAVVDLQVQDADTLAVSISLDLAAYLNRLKGLDEHAATAGGVMSDRIFEQQTAVLRSFVLRVDDLVTAPELLGVDASGNQLTFRVPMERAAVRLSFMPEVALGQSIVRLTGREGEVRTEFADIGKWASVNMTGGAEIRWQDTVKQYVVSGYAHILPKGLDHILFIIGLFLLSARFGTLLAQVSLFTVAHSVTLGLASVGLVSVPAAIVEPLIAASIAVIALENMYRTTLSRWRPYVIFGFGLLHGLGFASVLSDYGLPEADFLTALLAFNVGVELGQLTVLAGCFVAVGLVLNRSWYRRAISIPASVLLAIVGMYWCVERVAGAVA